MSAPEFTSVERIGRALIKYMPFKRPFFELLQKSAEPPQVFVADRRRIEVQPDAGLLQ